MWHSELPDVAVGGTTLHEAILSVARRAGERAALIDGPSGATVSYATLAQRIEGVAGGLLARGHGQGEGERQRAGGRGPDVLALWAPNMPPWAGIALGAMAAGLAVTPISPACSERELTRQVRDAGATVVATIPPLVPRALALRASTEVRDVIVLGEAQGATSIFELLATSAPSRPPAVTPDSLALIPYSSGTVGHPKGVLLSHANLVTVTRQLTARIRPDETDTMLAVAPFFHILGFTAMLTVPLAAGATVVTVPRFDADQTLRLIDDHGVTVLIGAPPMMPALLRDDVADLSSLRFVVAGGAPLRPATHRAVAARLPHAAVGQGWGLTELTGAAAIPDRAEGSVPGTVGRPLPNTSIRVVDVDSGADLAVGATGELWVRGPQRMSSYLHHPDATAALIADDGWLRTGDLGYVDDDGNVVIVDRLKELIKVRGQQVAPAELEELLQSHPSVADAAVVGRPDDRSGEVPVALVVTATPIDASDLAAWMHEQVAPHKRLAEVRFVDAIPRNPAGKILRRLLREHDAPSGVGGG